LEMYIEVSDTLAAKHILLCTVEKGEDGKLQFTGSGNAAVSPEGEAYEGDPEEINKQIRARAEDVVKQIREAADPIAKFDELMHALSQDGGLATNPDGYTFSAGQMVEEFENTTRELEYNAISDAVQSVFGYHIILRLRPDVRDAYISDYMNMQASAWMTELELEKTELFDTLDPIEMFKLYNEYQQKVYAVESES